MLAASIAGRLAAFVMTIVIVRRIGPESYGVFTFATSTVLLAAQLGGLGWPLLVTRMIPKYIQERDWSRLRGLRFSADLVMLVATVLIGTGFAVGGLLFLDRSNPLWMGMLVSAALVIPMGFRLLQRQQLAAINRAAPGIFLDEAVAPLFIVAACLVWGARQDTQIYAVYVFGTYASAMLSRILYRRWAPAEQFKAARVIEFKSWMLISLPMITGIASRVMLDRVDAIMLAPLSTVLQVGLYGAAFRIVAATNIPIMLNAFVRPRLARLYEGGDHERAAVVMRQYYAFTLLAAGGVSLFLFVFATPIVRIALGEEFLGAVVVMRILAVGQIFGALSEASSSYLLMSGKERAFGLLSVIGLALNVGLNLWLIPRWAAEGAAYATAFTNLLFFVVAGTIALRSLRTRRQQQRLRAASAD
jgi:O-antigen/teichoic acid export membrane protein